MPFSLVFSNFLSFSTVLPITNMLVPSANLLKAYSVYVDLGNTLIGGFIMRRF